MRYSAKTHKGLIREINEDCYKVIEPPEGSGQPALFIVADGMGGHSSGEVASRMAVQFAEELFIENCKKDGKIADPSELLRDIIKHSNAKIFEKASETIEHLGMGTTMTISAFLGERVVTGHVGDSRLYRVRNGAIEKITEDHSLIEELVRNGVINREEASHHPDRNIITKALGCERELTADIYETYVESGDKLLLCTDGLTNMIDDSEILYVLTNEEDPEIACKSLVERAIDNGGVDNITAIVIFL